MEFEGHQLVLDFGRPARDMEQTIIAHRRYSFVGLRTAGMVVLQREVIGRSLVARRRISTATAPLWPGQHGGPDFGFASAKRKCAPPVPCRQAQFLATTPAATPKKRPARRRRPVVVR